MEPERASDDIFTDSVSEDISFDTNCAEIYRDRRDGNPAAHKSKKKQGRIVHRSGLDNENNKNENKKNYLKIENLGFHI